MAGKSRSLLADLTGATKRDILKLAEAHGVRFLRLTFTDILGVNKNVEIPSSQFSKALDGDIMFDGSSIEGFVRIEESDMLLSPDLSTFKVFPGGDPQSRVGRLICDITMPDGSPFDGDPRAVLRRQVVRAAKLGFTMNAGMEAEFFLFRPAGDGGPATTTHDVGGYFDLAPMDLGEEARRAIVDVLEQMGFEVEAAHHEVAHGQHEIDFRYADAMTTADNLATFRFVVKHVAQQFGLVASFMPKPVFGQNGSGMHTHQSLFRDGHNAFFDPKGEFELSRIAHQYIGGLLAHARAMCAITNPLVNSYKRLVPGYEAPVNVAWSMRNRSPLIRVPARRGAGTRVELRSPDPIGESVPRAGRDAGGGNRRRRDEGHVARAGGDEHLGDVASREAAPSHRRPAARPERGVRRAREGRRDHGRAGRARQLPLSRGETTGVAGVHHAGVGLGTRALSREILR